MRGVGSEAVRHGVWELEGRGGLEAIWRMGRELWGLGK